MNEAYHARPSPREYIEAYFQDMGKLGVRRATHEPKATEHMTEVIELIGRLIQNGLAYEVIRRCLFPSREISGLWPPLETQA